MRCPDRPGPDGQRTEREREREAEAEAAFLYAHVKVVVICVLDVSKLCFLLFDVFGCYFGP